MPTETRSVTQFKVGKRRMKQCDRSYSWYSDQNNISPEHHISKMGCYFRNILGGGSTPHSIGRERATLRNWGDWKWQKADPLDSGEHIHTRVEIRSRAGDQGMNEGPVYTIGNASILAQHSDQPKDKGIFLKRKGEVTICSK